MEEFRSTEILDKEIQDDARRKADKLIKRADVDGQRLLDEVQTNIERTKAEKEALYTNRIDAHKKDLDSALPLEKERFLVSFEANAVSAEIVSFIEGLTAKKKAEVLRLMLLRYKDTFTGKKLSVQYHGMSKDEAMSLMTSVTAKNAVQSLEPLSSALATDSVLDTGFIIETADNTARYRVTIAELVAELLDTRRFELASALFGERISQ